MKLYDGLGPNPLAARIALAEKGVAHEREFVDMMVSANRTPDFYARNPSGTLPVLETSDRRCIAEITAIAEWLDETQPGPKLIGNDPGERAETRMWARRIDFEICVPLAVAFQAGRARKFFEPRKALPNAEAAEEYMAIGVDKLSWLEGLMVGRAFICGDRFSWADVPLWSFLSFFGMRGKQEEQYPHGGWLDGWRERLAARPAVKAAMSVPAA